MFDVDIESKSRKFLLDIMGEEDFNKLMDDGRIEIKHVKRRGKKIEELIYEMDIYGRVKNLTNGMSYCIIPVVSCISNLPIHDLLAIKYSYLKHEWKKIEEIANKINYSIDYTEYINALEASGWERIIIRYYPSDLWTKKINKIRGERDELQNRYQKMFTGGNRFRIGGPKK